ncbi:interferon-induced GTP-binding protein Mx [Dendryphion nanum]|uniref:Interferon-induced GTP-binding protein Mx n=1 Tax=Dendryphion nanum TaxID=256645 RepID=A0A9P9DBT1_9PLEO|nr:interferon-induced GTP-binding protein Mx [Dendryphion nanum]
MHGEAKLEAKVKAKGFDSTTVSLEGLQSDEQRLVLDTVSQVRKCGLDGIIALPQLVVCGDQSAGKSSVLEALTEIPFPRNDELCTRFATEIILRRSTIESLTIKVIPDDQRPPEERQAIEGFKESITNFDGLPEIMDRAMEVMGLSNKNARTTAFARDVLSIEIEGPSRPQLTLVDLPGLIQNETKGVTTTDVALVKEITDRYISQSRTICLAVVSATNDYANQGILSKVRKVDPDGERTLGIITKPDRLPSGSGTEAAYINLARNEDIFFKLGWHVIKNRSFEEGDNSFMERNASEAAYFRNSNFRCLSKDNVGVDSLRDRLSRLLFEHIKQELPKLHGDLNQALEDSQGQLSALGDHRSTPEECREYLSQLSLHFHRVCTAAVSGHYEGSYFRYATNERFSSTSPAAIRRLRAIIQKMNADFAANMRMKGHSYKIDRSDKAQQGDIDLDVAVPPSSRAPVSLNRSQYLAWVGNVVIRNRGRELPGSFNPLLVGELFWQQSEKWPELATSHVEDIADVCRNFLETLLEDLCPKDVISRLWAFRFEEELKERYRSATAELDRIVQDLKGYPINYNHYYTDIVKKSRLERERELLEISMENATTRSPLPECRSNHTSTQINVGAVIDNFSRGSDPQMETHSCEDALDRLEAIYKVSQKTFVANVTVQVVERHTMRGLEDIFSPIFVSRLSNIEIENIASEPASCKRQRDFFRDRIEKLKIGHDILRRVMKSAAM